MVPFTPSHGILYILVIMDYVSKLVETIAFPLNDGRTILKFLKTNTFTQLGILRTLINYKGLHIVSRLMNDILEQYNIKFRLKTFYHL